MEITSSLLNSEEMLPVKDSIEEVSKIDGKDDFRVRLIEYINDSSNENDDMFFYEMLEFVRFLDPKSDSIAYTTPDYKISLNAPCDKIGESIRKWDFVYDHECLHQLWNTFKVGDEIVKAGIEYKHELLNIASDCVINDYLRDIRRKDAPEIGVYPEVIKEQFGVDYDRKNDTQFSLYVKILEAYNKNHIDLQQLIDMLGLDEMGGDGPESDGDGEGQGQGQGKGKGKGKPGKNGRTSNPGGDGEGEDGEDGQDGENGKGGQGKGKDKGKGKGQNGQDGEDGQDGDGPERKGKGKGQGSGEGNNVYSDIDMERVNRAKEIIERYRVKISGQFGTFIRKCKSSQSLVRDGFAQNVRKGGKGWNNDLQHIVEAYVKQRVFKFKRIFQKTYKRIKRGTGFVKPGEFINPGKRVVDKKMTINIAFYIDNSGSMSNSIDNVFTAAYRITESIKKQYRNDKVIDSVVFKMHTFNDSIKEIKFGQKSTADGGTCNFEEIFKYILNNTNDYLVNIIITDAEMGVQKKVVTDTIKNLNGIVVFIANSENSGIRELSKEHPVDLRYILAKGNFEI